MIASGELGWIAANASRYAASVDCVTDMSVTRDSEALAGALQRAQVRRGRARNYHTEIADPGGGGNDILDDLQALPPDLPSRIDADARQITTWMGQAGDKPV